VHVVRQVIDVGQAIARARSRRRRSARSHVIDADVADRARTRAALPQRSTKVDQRVADALDRRDVQSIGGPVVEPQAPSSRARA